MPEPEAKLEITESDIFVLFDGRRVAKRGRPGTRHADTWVPLEPGFAVYSSADDSILTIEQDGVSVSTALH
jgi:hypothetical protein